MTQVNGRWSATCLALIAWWRNLRAAWACFDELRNCGDGIGAIARDVGLSGSDLRIVAAKRPNAADQLKLRLEALPLDRAAALRADPLVMRDLERVCSVCGSKRQCKRDWILDPGDEAWRGYCRNAPTLESLAIGSGASASI
jgi:hypothetical protein